CSLGFGGPLIEEPAQRDPVDRLHRQQFLGLVIGVPVKTGDVRMTQAAQDRGLAAEALEEVLVLDQPRRQTLDRDQLAGGVVPCENDPPGRALAERAQLGVGVADAQAISWAHECAYPQLAQSPGPSGVIAQTDRSVRRTRCLCATAPD